MWQSYILGLDPNDEASQVICEATADQTGVEPGSVRIALRNADVRGATVTACLDSKTDGGEWTLGVKSATVTGGGISFTTPIVPDGIILFRIRLEIAP